MQGFYIRFVFLFNAGTVVDEVFKLQLNSMLKGTAATLSLYVSTTTSENPMKSIQNICCVVWRIECVAYFFLIKI